MVGVVAEGRASSCSPAYKRLCFLTAHWVKGVFVGSGLLAWGQKDVRWGDRPARWRS